MFKIVKFANCVECRGLWETFESHAYCTGFQSYAWISNWQKTIGNSICAKLQIIIVYNVDGEIVMILPFMITQKNKIKILSWTFGDFSNGLFHENFYSVFSKHTFTKVWKNILQIVEHFDLLYFANQPELIHGFRNPFVSYLDSYLSYSPNYYIKLEGTFLDFEKTLRKKLVQDSGRQLRRLTELGDVKFVFLSDLNINSQLVETLIKMKSARYDSTGANNIFKMDHFKKFYLDFEINCNSIIKTHISALVLNDQVLAVHWGIIKEDVFYYIMPANDWGIFVKLSPGRILLLKLIDWCFQNKIKIFDFTVGGESYKLDWANNQNNMFNYLYANNIVGFIAKIIYQFHTYRKKKKTIKNS
ncbi:MAG: GNAT family N-acetyltransferase [Bacteroidetes bacterium]|nr:GNAT family N-acetyltransferase [Bacteroidota bacterium]